MRLGNHSISQLVCISSFTHDALQPASVCSRPTSSNNSYSPTKAAISQRRLLDPKHYAFAVSPYQESPRETIIPKSGSSRFFALTNDRARSEISLGYIPSQVDAFRKDYIRMQHASRCDYDTSRNDFGTIVGESVPLTSIELSPGIDRSRRRTHPDPHQASTPRGIIA